MLVGVAHCMINHLYRCVQHTQTENVSKLAFKVIVRDTHHLVKL